eukprot:6304388-Pyramimonas_sp.AAC.2
MQHGRRGSGGPVPAYAGRAGSAPGQSGACLLQEWRCSVTLCAEQSTGIPRPPRSPQIPYSRIHRALATATSCGGARVFPLMSLATTAIIRASFGIEICRCNAISFYHTP